MVVKFAVEGRLLHAKFNLYRCTGGVWAGAIFMKLSGLYAALRWAKFQNLGGFSQGVPELWGFNVEGSAFPQIFSVPYRQGIRRIAKHIGGVRTCSRPSTTMPSVMGLGLRTPPRIQKRPAFCMSDCLLVRHALERRTCRLC